MGCCCECDNERLGSTNICGIFWVRRGTILLLKKDCSLWSYLINQVGSYALNYSPALMLQEDVGHVARTGKVRYTYKLFFFGKTENLKKYNRPGHRWEDNECEKQTIMSVSMGFSWRRTGYGGGLLSERWFTVFVNDG